jgi:hypothetical protein
LHQIAALICCFVALSDPADDSICWENALISLRQTRRGSYGLSS